MSKFYGNFFLIFFVSLFGCGKSQEKNSGSIFDGSWSTACSVGADPFGSVNSVSGRVFLNVSANRWVQTTRSYDDPVCSTEALVIEQSFEVRTGNAIMDPPNAVETDFTPLSVSVTVKSDRFLMLYNQTNAFCGGGFVKNTPKALTQSLCANDGSIKNWFDKVFTIYRLDANKLYPGTCDLSDQSSDCRSTTKRSKKISESPMFTKV